MVPDSSKDNSKQKSIIKRITSHRAFIPITIFIGVVLIFSFSSQFSERPPEIEAIIPQIAGGGDIVVITGTSFGDVRQGGEVSIAGVRPVSSSYYEWTDKRISVQIPLEAGSGLVSVTTRTGKSNNVLFTNKNDIPVVIEGPAKPGFPYIEDVFPLTGSVGDLLTVSGINFGEDRNTGRIIFSAIRSHIEGRGSYRSPDEEIQYIQASEIDFDYNNWSENEIKVRVPDGSTSGNFYVETNKGRSNPIYFEVVEPVGTKMLTAKRGYQAQYGVTVRNVVSRGENGMYFWLPKVLRTVTQNNMENINSPDPYWNFSSDMFVYHLENMASSEIYQLSQTFWFDRYGLETKIQSAAVPLEYADRRLTAEYTKETEMLPVTHEKIDKTVKEAVKWETNPYVKAQLLFTYCTETFEYTEFVPSSSILDALEYKKADAYIYSLLYTTLLRNAGIPARVITGYIVYGDKKTKDHYWTEYYLEGFGWVPVDIALADGAKFEDFPYVDEPKQFYFGNIDNQHICIGRGEVHTIQIKPDNRTVHNSNIFPLQSSHEELSPSIQSYSAAWQKLRIIEWW